MRDVILYVHVPFCSSKCHFCSWVSPIPTAQLVKSRTHYEAYTEAVVQEIEFTARSLNRSDIRSKLVYFGGGTPSLLCPDELGKILQTLLREFPQGPDFNDVTIEVSPHTATYERMAGLLAAGFTRISFGAQSFNEDRVRTLGRAHSAADTISAFRTAREVGFANINIDLMVGLPEETEHEADETVRQALALEPDHMSIYVYKKYPSTVLARAIDSGKIRDIATAVAITRYERAAEMLAIAGYSEYMFQLFHRNEKRCFCDYHYFNLDNDYLGFGLGAHALVAGKCLGHTQTLDAYLGDPHFNYAMPAAGSDQVLETKFFEMMHTAEGFDERKFFNRLRVGLEEARVRSPRLDAMYISAMNTGSIESTQQGFRFRDRRNWLNWIAKPSSWGAPPQAKEKLELVTLS